MQKVEEPKISFQMIFSFSKLFSEEEVLISAVVRFSGHVSLKIFEVELVASVTLFSQFSQ